MKPQLNRRDRASVYLARIQPNKSGDGPWRENFKAAIALVKGFEYTPEEAFAILRIEFNLRCFPRLSEIELWRVVVAAAYAKDRRPPGWLNAGRSI
jgi:hypothetical protein